MIRADQAPPPQVVIKDFNELQAMLPKEDDVDKHRSGKSKMIQVLLQIFILQGGNIKRVKMADLMRILHDKHLMDTLISHKDPYYLEMLERKKESVKMMREHRE